MIDEVRVLNITCSATTHEGENDDNNLQILIGLGCMAWSGGVLNSSPFCLYRWSKL
jgi:hypothetical protein